MASAASARVGIVEIEADYTLPALLMCISVPFFIFGVWGMLKGETGEGGDSGEASEVSDEFAGQKEEI